MSWHRWGESVCRGKSSGNDATIRDAHAISLINAELVTVATSLNAGVAIGALSIIGAVQRISQVATHLDTCAVDRAGATAGVRSGASVSSSSSELASPNSAAVAASSRGQRAWVAVTNLSIGVGTNVNGTG